MSFHEPAFLPIEHSYNDDVGDDEDGDKDEDNGEVARPRPPHARGVYVGFC